MKEKVITAMNSKQIYLVVMIGMFIVVIVIVL